MEVDVGRGLRQHVKSQPMSHAWVSILISGTFVLKPIAIPDFSYTIMSNMSFDLEQVMES